MVLSYAEDILRCLSLPTHLNVCVVHDFWIAPPTSFLKLNVDGSVLPSLLRGGFGGVIRDHLGVWVAGFSSSVVFGDILRVEILAILQGLIFA